MAANPFAESTGGGRLDGIAARHPDREAIVFGRDRSLTLARGLTALGLGPGDKVAVWLPSRPPWFSARQACARIGAVVVALNPRYRAHELSYILAQSDSKALLLTDHFGAIDYRVVRFVKDGPRPPGPHGDEVQRGNLREQALQEMTR
ncbi:MAG TPA: AMP-binding protein [Methylomirabilota bacterium]|nr:AMP-binding protein [Methylomirabilota bacterium]